MTQSPIPQLKEAIRELRDVYGLLEATTEDLHKAFIRHTKSYRAPTLGEYMRLLERFKIIQSKMGSQGRTVPGVWIICPESEWEL